MTLSAESVQIKGRCARFQAGAERREPGVVHPFRAEQVAFRRCHEFDPVAGADSKLRQNGGRESHLAFAGNGRLHGTNLLRLTGCVNR